MEMEPMQVLTALSDFIALFVPPEKKKLNDILLVYCIFIIIFKLSLIL